MEIGSLINRKINQNYGESNEKKTLVLEVISKFVNPLLKVQ